MINCGGDLVISNRIVILVLKTLLWGIFAMLGTCRRIGVKRVLLLHPESRILCHRSNNARIVDKRLYESQQKKERST